MTAYHPANMKLVDYDPEKVIELAEHAARLGVLIHIQGIPFGAPRHESDVSSLPGTLGERNAKDLGNPDRGPIKAARLGES